MRAAAGIDAVVVDTNVPIAANGKAEHAGPACVIACVDTLEVTREQCLIVLDDGLHILGEYMRNLLLAGQPGAGDFFMKWIWQNQANPRHCERVRITPRPGDEDFMEFPADPALSRFDRSDRKFVAVARASRHSPEVMNATDTDWWHYRDLLLKHGVRVRFLCPDLMEA